MQRYVDAKLDGNKVVLTADDVFHISRVMRAKVGTKIEVVCEQKLYIAVIQAFNPLVIEIESEVEQVEALPFRLILAYCLAKGDKNEFVIQKATELGVSEIILLTSERTIVKYDPATGEKKLQRFKAIAKEAAEQSKRLDVPVITGVISLEDYVNQDFDYKYAALTNETVDRIMINQLPTSFAANARVTIVVGSEGGFSRDEDDLLISNGFIPVSLGKRILRSETAALIAVSAFTVLQGR